MRLSFRIILFWVTILPVFAQETDSLEVAYYYSNTAVSTKSNRVVLSLGNDFKVWDLNKGIVLKSYKIPGNIKDIHQKGYERVLVLTERRRGFFEVWDAEKGVVLKNFYAKVKPESLAAIAPDMSFMAFIDDKDRDRLKIWDITQNKIRYVVSNKSYWVSSIAISPNSKWIVEFCTMVVGRVIHQATGKWREFSARESADGMFHGTAFSADGQFLAATADEFSGEVVRLLDCKFVYSLNNGDFRARYNGKVAIAPNMQYFLVEDYDKIYTINKAGKIISSIADTTIRIRDLNISANSKYLLITDDQDAIRVYEATTGKLFLTYLPVGKMGMIVYDAAGNYRTSDNALKELEQKPKLKYHQSQLKKHEPTKIAQKMAVL